jgi:protein-disulfide isomerase
MHTSGWRTDSNWGREARIAGVPDTAAFIVCLRSPTTSERLARHLALADSLRVTGTPTFVARAAIHHGVIDTFRLRALAIVQ